ncbi:HEAT repeat domain-containing protein [Candidatus Micrarchaeota archaeon]|nr:HEAT repeat domain-containing protein [Candidatus Micrarchaeota archaeon]
MVRLMLVDRSKTGFAKYCPGFVRGYECISEMIQGYRERSLEEKIERLVARRAWKSLVRIGTPAIPTLIRTLNDSDLQVRVGAGIAIAEIMDLRGLGKALENTHLVVRKNAARALEKIGKKAVAILIDGLGHYDWRVKMDSANTLAKIGKDALPALMDALDDDDLGKRMYVIDSLIKMGNDGVAGLIKALNDKSGFLQTKAATALGNMGNRDSVPHLIAGLKHSDPSVRLGFALVLGKIMDARAVHALTEALGDNDSIMRGRAAWALGKIGDVSAVPALIGAINDRDGHARLEIAASLGKIGDSRAIPVLMNALNDEEIIVRRAAALALGEMEDVNLEKVRAILMEFVADSENKRKAEKQSAEIYLELTDVLRKKKKHLEIPKLDITKKPRNTIFRRKAD